MEAGLRMAASTQSPDHTTHEREDVSAFPG